MTVYQGGTVWVTLTANVPDQLAEQTGLNAGADRLSGAQHQVRQDDAVELVQAGVAVFRGPNDDKGNTVGGNGAQPARSISGTTGALQPSDAHRVVETTGSAATTLTVPTNATAAIPVGSVVRVRQYGTGQVTVSPAAGVTIRARVGLKTIGQYAQVTLTKRAANEWVLTGEAAA